MADTRELEEARRMTVPEHEWDETRHPEYEYGGSGVRHRAARREMRSLSTIPLMIGRALFGGYFVYSGINHFRNRKMVTEYAKAKGVPIAEIAVPATGLMLVLGGLSVLTGVRPKVGASAVAAFLLGVSPQMHAFWKETDPERQMQEMINFTKNMALVGGAMFAASLAEPWPYHVKGVAQPATF